MRLRIGTSGYSYPGSPPKGWYGVFYPGSRGKKFDELAYYASFFNSVEINSTFYRPPAPGMAEAWAKRTPADFEFAVKVWQKFTHPVKLGEEVGEGDRSWEAPADADAELFKKGIGPLADSGKLGVLLFQYPPGFHRTRENIEKLRWTLAAFQSYPKAVELRHKSWSDQGDEAKRLLGESGATWAVIDEPKFASSVVQEFEPAGETLSYLRLHGRNQEKWWSHGEAWERYDYFYGAEEIRSLADRIRAWADKSALAKIFIFFNNHARGQAVANALTLQRELGQETTAALPEALVRAYPELGKISPCW
ncbi:MAG: DUF72 domain-containing protein [Deltaproteobacteria bacterium]|nr:DUF72 domain-containing protein [Deltaproteobacteria bacterium]MBI2347061.1 DUF72 domain-containing protein [Deltaproteobacteria bacterium]MBI3062307.1 DUF72 domain-containing protein [Deltaproteobacteria bacterium]